MQFRDLTRQYEAHKADIDDAISRVLASGCFIMGSEVAQLEQQLATRLSVKHCIACASGTDALRLALMLWNVGPGDAVFVPDFTFFATAEVVAQMGAIPIFVDVDPKTFNIDACDLVSKIHSTLSTTQLKPKVIVAVDLFGLPADYPQLREIANTFRLPILEDGAQGFGGKIGARQACTFGDIATTSFFPAKPLGCYGDGGALFTDSDEWAEQARSLIQHGKGEQKYQHIAVGLNSRLDAVQAAILSAKLQFFDAELLEVNRIANCYTQALSEVVATPQIPEAFQSAWAQYTLVLQNNHERDSLRSHLSAHQIPAMVYYPTPLHQQPVFQAKGISPDICPQTQRLSETVLSLPMGPYLDTAQQEQVINAVRLGLSTIRNR